MPLILMRVWTFFWRVKQLIQPQNSRTNRFEGGIWDNPTNHHLWREEAVVTWSLLLLGEGGEGTKNPPKNAAKATWTINPLHGVTKPVE